MQSPQHANASWIGPQQELPTPFSRQLQDTTDTGVGQAKVTVTVQGTTYHGNPDQTPATVRIEKGCGVYENFRNDLVESRVTCCGDGDCLLGFLTQHQWLLHWL